MVKIQFETGQVVDFDGQPTQKDIDEVAAKLGVTKPKPQKGFLQTVGEFGKDVAKSIAETGLRVLTDPTSPVSPLRNIPGGEYIQKAIPEKANLPILGETTIKYSDKPLVQLGQRLEDIANVYAPEGGAQIAKQGFKGLLKAGVKTGVKTAVPTMAAFGAGKSLEEGKGLIESAGTGLAYGALGVPVGATLGAGGAIAGKLLEPVEQKASKYVKEAINKAIKPSITKTRTPAAASTYMKDAEEAFKIISQRKPEIMLEDEGIKVAKNPETRKELLDALNETKKKVFEEYHSAAVQAGEKGATFDSTPILSELDRVSNDLKYSPEIRNYASQLKSDLGELTGQSPEVVEARIADLNNSLSGFYDGRVSKAKAQVDASVASLMRQQQDSLIEGTTGVQYQALKNQYKSLKTIESDLARQVNLEARKSATGLSGLTDIFTGGDLFSGILTSNPTLILRGLAGKGIQKAYKYLNDPNRYIKNAFQELEKAYLSPGSNIVTRSSEYLKNKLPIGLQAEATTPVIQSLEKEIESVTKSIKLLEKENAGKQILYSRQRQLDSLRKKLSEERAKLNNY